MMHNCNLYFNDILGKLRNHIYIMNAIIALCHFCELHGPSILFCTQVMCDKSHFYDQISVNLL